MSRRTSFILCRLENTALYFTAGFLVGKVAASFFIQIFVLSLIAGITELFFWKAFIITSTGDEGEDFENFFNTILESLFLYLPAGFFLARLT
ncbi:MAG: hypothetical protein QXD61_11795 [Candidatus Caldarchaeum sp.]